MSYDTWKSTEPDHDAPRSGDNRFRCLDCEWAGKGYMARARHFDLTRGAHRIVWHGDPRQSPANEHAA